MVADQKAFDEAILLSQTRLRIADPNLTRGAVEKVAVSTSARVYERPWCLNGSFATVYKFRTQDGQHKALRCFRVAMKPEMKDRYEQLSNYFGRHVQEITAGFHYYDEGLWIDETIQGAVQRVPRAIILMNWIEGGTLLAKVDEFCRKSDREGLGNLCEQWLSLLSVLRCAHMAHGDLSGGNVMIGSDGGLVLVDYDSVYIPAFEGMAPFVSGQPDYQHPGMHQRAFDEHMDDFSGYVIFVALRALQVRPQLWDAYAPRGKLGQLLEANLLFTHNDFVHPRQSKLFAELEQLPDPLLQYAIQTLKYACFQPIEQVRLPPLDHEYRAIACNCTASAEDADEQRLRINLALLKHAIHHQMTRDIIYQALKIEQAYPSPLEEKALRDAVRAAKKQFIEAFLPSQVTIQADRLGKVLVRWIWPEEELVQFAVVAWRSDRPPRQAEEQGTYLYQPISKQSYQQRGCFSFQVSGHASIYIQVYFAIPDRVATKTRMTWIYSHGDEHMAKHHVIRRRTSLLNV